MIGLIRKSYYEEQKKDLSIVDTKSSYIINQCIHTYKSYTSVPTCMIYMPMRLPKSYRRLPNSHYGGVQEGVLYWYNIWWSQTDSLSWGGFKKKLFLGLFTIKSEIVLITIVHTNFNSNLVNLVSNITLHYKMKVLS